MPERTYYDRTGKQWGEAGEVVGVTSGQPVPKPRERRDSTASWGDRPRPKGLGTKHLHFDVPKSGYERENIMAADHTRNKFYDNKYRLEKPPNVVFGETKEEKAGQYLVTIPPHHEAWRMDPTTGTKLPSPESAKDTVRRRNDDIVGAILFETANKVNASVALDKRIKLDQLKAKRKLVYEQLRKADTTIAVNPWKREQSLVDVDLAPTPPLLGKHGTVTYLRAFPSERSKPKFTNRVPGVGFA